MHRDDYDRVDFGPADDDYRGFAMSDEETARGPLILALAAGVLIVFAAVVWNTYRQGVRDGSGGVPVILAQDAPYKRKPDEAGGVTTPNLEARVYDEMDGSSRPVPGSLRRLPGSVTPERDIPSAPEGETLQGGPPLELRPDMDDGTDDPETGMPNALRDEVRRLADLEGRADDAAERTDLASINETPLAAPAPRAQPTPTPVRTAMFDFAETGLFLVQMAAFRESAAAETAWKRAVASDPDMFFGAQRDIQRADLGARGVFYRLRVGRFATRDAAGEFCAALKADGGDCIVVQQ